MRRPLAKVAHQAFLPVLFRTQFENLLFPEEIHRESAGYAIRKFLHRCAFEIFWIILEEQRMAGFVELDELPLQHGISGSSAVLQVIYLPFQQRILLKQFHDSKRSAAHG